jgi:hypothetical protein
MDSNFSFTNISTVAQLLGTFVTAFATLALWLVTKQLTKETRQLAERSAQPFVLASLEPSPWAINLIEMKLLNTGNAVAFDVQTKFDPPLKLDTGTETSSPVPYISALRPGQSIGTLLGNFPEIEDKEYEITTSWSLAPGNTARSELRYKLNLNQYLGTGVIGGEPLIKIAEEAKKIREGLDRSRS